MCLNPITIPNQSKYVSLKYKDRFLMQIPCGQCAECQATIGNQWYYRSWYEWNEVESANGYILFDTLTYSDKHIPKLSNTWSLLPRELDFSCFDYQHIRKFLQTLRMRLIRAGYRKDSFRYFLSTEYGTSEFYNRSGRMVRATHRPHYHVLFYVYDNRIDPLWLSKTISEVWFYGRTDGLPYKTAAYVLGKNVIKPSCQQDTKLRTCRYVTKYVQKSCLFDFELRHRVSKVMYKLAEFASDNPEKWLETEEAHRERLKLLRYVNQFHRQSQHFGETALRDLDLNSLYKYGCLFMPDNDKVIIPIPLPMYYRRKLFYDLYDFNGGKYWVKNELGKEYDAIRFGDIRRRLIDKLTCTCLDYNLHYNCERLADYLLNERGRIKGVFPDSTLLERWKDIDYIAYTTSSDKLQFGVRGLSTKWLGDAQSGYLSERLFPFVRLADFIAKYVYLDVELEKQLADIYSHEIKINSAKQNAYELSQKLSNAYKIIFG